MTEEGPGLQSIQGYREVDHTADVALHVWAPDLASLFAQAAEGLNALAGAQLGPGRRLPRKFDLYKRDDESLLVAFLTELVFAQESANLAFEAFELEITEHHLMGRALAAELSQIACPIKAVTYNDLQIRRGAHGLEVQIVFDV